MIRSTYTKANWDQTTQLAIILHNQGLKANQVVDHLRSIKYTVDGLHYNATNVSGVVQGMEIVEAYMADHIAKATVPSINDAIKLVNTGIDSGTLKYTKGKRVHIVPQR